MDNTITNPANSSETYTYGKRGRKPRWVQDYEAKNGKPVEEVKETTPESTPVAITVVLEGDTLVNKTIDKSYTFGAQRGKRPAWVSEWMEKNPTLIPQKDLVPTGRPRKTVDDDTTDEDSDDVTDLPTSVKPVLPDADMYQWHFKSQMNNNAIVVARNDLEVVTFLNQCFKIPYNRYSLEIFWVKAPYTCNLSQGVWRLKKDETEWTPYPTLSEKEIATQV